MSNYLVSARKYRPSRFEDVIGQEHITRTLDNAIAKNQIAHAYLFCGPRGVGKTTCARIFSQLINENTNSEYNIFELDGASNNSVDDIRNLIDQVKIPPQIGKYKTYIIDEVHMLSKSAFNAFLKTLEEPPTHSIFILATTEKEKIIPTILSRCQIFDFNKITVDQISNYLSQLAENEKINVDKKTMRLIAKKSDGSLRDGLSIFDKIHTLCNNNWEHNTVLKILLSLDTTFVSQLTQNILDQNIHSCLAEVNNVLEKGYDGKELIQVLINYFRNLMMIKDQKTQKLVNEEPSILELMAQQSQQLSNSQLLLALSCLSECDINYNKSVNQQFLIELCVMKLCSLSEKELKKKLLIRHPNKEFDKSVSKNAQNEDNKEISPKNLIDNSTIPKTISLKKEGDECSEQPIINSDLISITEELNAMQEKDIIKKNENEKNHDWSTQDLLDTWTVFSNQLKTNQKINLHNIFDRYLPVKNNNEIIVEVVSLSEKAEIEDIKREFLFFAKKKLQNDFVKIIINISEEEKKNMLHTKEEKYAHIFKENKNIKLLKEKLELTIIQK